VTIFCVAIGILKEVERTVMKIKRMDQLFDFLKNLSALSINFEKILRVTV